MAVRHITAAVRAASIEQADEEADEQAAEQAAETQTALQAFMRRRAWPVQRARQSAANSMSPHNIDLPIADIPIEFRQTIAAMRTLSPAHDTIVAVQ